MATTVDTLQIKRKNTIEICTTGFLWQAFIDPERPSIDFFNYDPMISYKRKLNKNNALRLGISGFVWYKKYDKNQIYETTIKSNYLCIRQGIEHYYFFNKTVALFFGIDFITTRTLENLSRNNPNGYYSTYVKTERFGLLPFGGCLYKINERISFSTEVSYSFVYSIYKTKGYGDNGSASSSLLSQIMLPQIFNLRICF
jgi:hypothetical protein